MRPTFHLVPAEAWSAAAPADDYRPTSLASEGFVHATDGEDEVLRTGDRHYRDEPGDWLVLTIDLENLEITGPDGGSIKFDLDEFRRHCLLNGLDDIGLTLEKGKAIDSFEKKNSASRPWAA